MSAHLLQCVHGSPPHHPLILQRMTPLNALHISASHKALFRLCVRPRQAGKKPRFAISASSSENVRRLCCQAKEISVWLIMWGNYTISIHGTAKGPNLGPAVSKL